MSKDLLTELWHRRVRSIIGIVGAGETEHREVATVAAQIGADYYGRFIIELLQNASDQATEAGLKESTVTIVATPQLFAMINEGQPFTEEGLKSITSLGLSTKNPQHAIGNKGIGFKSVFQVTESPEIYSSNSLDKDFSEEPGIMFRLSLTPFAAAPQEQVLRDIIIHELSDNSSLSADDIAAEVRAAAPFKFPIPVTAEDMGHRLDALNSPARGQSMVVLPLRQDPDTADVVDAAIQDLLQDRGSAILFLPAVTLIHIKDTVHDAQYTIARRSQGEAEEVAGVGRINTVITTITHDGVEKEGHWRVIERKMGTADVVDPTRAANEAEAIHKAAMSLPGASWDTVTASPVGVAIPLPPSSHGDTTDPLDVTGKICIGLPTKDKTGTPAWINAHFFGHISRTRIDLVQNRYNALLFSETVRLHQCLIEDLKSSPSPANRRAATLAFAKAEGPLSRALFREDGQATGEIVLSIDGRTYHRPSESLIPSPQDMDALLLMFNELTELHSSGLQLPDTPIFRGARDLLIALVGKEPDRAEMNALLLDRDHEGQSQVETVARKRRGDGPTFWVPFLNWLVGRFLPSDLENQRILPVGREGLAAPAQRVFLPPASAALATQEAGPDGELSELPTALAETLQFLDANAAPSRKPSSRELTDLAARLAPDKGEALIRRPRLHDLINDAVGPLMAQLPPDISGQDKGIRLLRQAVEWLLQLSDQGRSRLSPDAIRVPVLGDHRQWLWLLPIDTYFGPGWCSEPTNALLAAAYSGAVYGRVVPWEGFATALDLPEEDREQWVGALELLGVSQSPKIIQSKPGTHAAPLASHSYAELTVEGGVPCPIPLASAFWASYLNATRRRRADTTSGQKFDFRSTTWVDGLENEESRGEVVQLLLLHHDRYAATTSTHLERYNHPNHDSTTVPSLWVHAIKSNDWPVVPTQRGSIPPAQAWIVEGHQRGLVQSRLSLLNQVTAPHKEALSILNAIGVTDLENAGVRRLLQAIDRLGTACAEYDEETKVVALSLAEELFGHLQTAYADQSDPLPDLRSICFPLGQRKEAIGIRGDTIGKAYVNDDPVRAGFMPDFADSLVWPLQIRQAHKNIVLELRSQLGEMAAIHTRDAEIQSRFAEDDTVGRAQLLQWLEQQFPAHPVAGDLGCLIAYMGRQETSPGGREFQRTWTMFHQTSLAFGHFPSDSPTPYFFDRHANLLQVDTTLSNTEMLEATWMLVGSSYRDTWAAYARELEKGSPSKFLADRRISSLQRENVEQAIGIATAERFRHVRAIAYVLWSTRNRGESPRTFDTAWTANARNVTRLSEWLGASSLAEHFAAALGMPEEKASIALMQTLGIHPGDWQRARQTLGMQPFPFTHKTQAWRSAIKGLVSILKVRAARSASTSLDQIQPILSGILAIETPPEIAFTLDYATPIVPRAIAVLKAVLQTHTDRQGVELLIRVLETLAATAIVDLDNLALDEAPIRDVRVYRDDDQHKRERDAKARLDGLLIVARPLARHHEENLDENALLLDPKVVALTQGWWANCFTVMPAVQRVLHAQAPTTATRMSEERVFRDPAPANEMLRRFSELSQKLSPPPAPPVREVTVLGTKLPESEIDADLLLGSAGSIGKQLQNLALSRPCNPNIRNTLRQFVNPPTPGPKPGPGGGGGGTGGGGDSRRDRELAGLLGEAFVFEQFRLTFPDFDERAWCSANRLSYGIEGEGSDRHGCDFQYRDGTGALTGRTDAPLCLLEVKSSSAAASAAFPMSANEWDTARRCHESDDTVYLIIRVATVREAPQIVDIIMDPFDLYLQRRIAISNQDMWVHVGDPITSTPGLDSRAPDTTRE